MPLPAPLPGARSAAPATWPRAAEAGEAKTVAKGQKRSNREIKKPKQAKPKPPAAASTLSNTLSESRNRAKSPKK
jgi:hypothetical protein